MNKINAHSIITDTMKTAGRPRKPVPADKGPLPSKDVKDPPLRAAKGDDDLMSEEQAAPPHG